MMNMMKNMSMRTVIRSALVAMRRVMVKTGFVPIAVNVLILMTMKANKLMSPVDDYVRIAIEPN